MNKITIKSYNQDWDYHKNFYYLFYIKNNLIGSYCIEDDGEYYTLSALYIQEEFRGKGYSKILLEHAIEKYKKLYLQVYINNTKAINLYKKYKFQFSDPNKKDNRYLWMRNHDYDKK